jgi:hypothetical protein
MVEKDRCVCFALRKRKDPDERYRRFGVAPKCVFHPLRGNSVAFFDHEVLGSRDWPSADLAHDWPAAKFYDEKQSFEENLYIIC